MSLVNIILYFLFLCGVLLFAGSDISSFFKSLALRKSLVKGTEKGKQSRVYRWVELLLSAKSGKAAVDPGSFIILLIMLFVLVFLVCLKSLTLPASFIAAAALTALPLMFLFAGLESARTKNSKEGISMVTEFYRQYRMKNRNIYEAIEATIEAEGDYPGCRKQLYRLLLKLRASGSQSELRRSIDDFSEALGTVWGRMFATCIRISAERGEDVSEGLSDIIAQLKKAGELAEDRKRLNSESARMTMYLVPVLYAGTMLLAVYYLDVSPAKLVRNQFFTPEGILFFTATVFLFIFNLILIKLIDNTRLDF